MTELLQKAIERAQSLPEDEQDRVARVMLHEIEAVVQNGEEESQQKPFWERIVERSKEVPDEVWEELPEDGAAEIDHYLYGSPKRNS